MTTTVTNMSTNDDSSSSKEELQYLSGFGNTLESECLKGALPRGRNNPRVVPFHLYAEQLSGTAFTAPRASNRRTWLYRIRPSVTQQQQQTTQKADSSSSSSKTLPVFGRVLPSDCRTTIEALRWRPYASASKAAAAVDHDFVSGMQLMCTGGEASVKNGLSIYMYAFQKDMKHSNNNSDRHFYNADGDVLLVPQQGSLEVLTEVGRLQVRPGEIVVIPRGMVIQINRFQTATEETAEATDAAECAHRGYVLEIFRGSFQLPELGPIGANGLANARDFLHPTAWCISNQSDYEQPCEIIVKMDSYLHTKQSPHSPFDVVAWHGNYLPYKYDLSQFCAVNSVTYDHLDPSIYTVLTCATDTAGTALADFVIFPPRMMATDQNTLRPPWFHRNTMSEFMGLIHGAYDAKQDFLPGGASLHNCMVPHGPDATSYDKAVSDPCEQPVYFDKGLAFMFETCLPLKVAPCALEEEDTATGSSSGGGWRDKEYAACWNGLNNPDNFTGWDQFTTATTTSDTNTAAAAAAAAAVELGKEKV